MTELDLEKGNPDLAEKIASRQSEGQARSRSARGTSSTSKSKTSSAAKTQLERIEAELRSRLDRTFDRVAEWRASRGDDELATVIVEDKDAMGQGVVSLTHVVPWARPPLLMFLNLVEPVLAFGRVSRILFSRWVAHREAVAAERTAQQQGVEYQTVEN